MKCEFYTIETNKGPYEVIVNYNDALVSIGPSTFDFEKVKSIKDLNNCGFEEACKLIIEGSA